VSDTSDIVIIGSQSILGLYPDAPELLLVSVEADVFPKDRPEASILIDGAIGERSVFHETFGYYAHGVDESTAVLPTGWKERLITIQNENTMGATGWCLEPHDLAVSKLAAGREKDTEFVRVLLQHGLATSDLIADRFGKTDFGSEEDARLVRERLERILAR